MRYGSSVSQALDNEYLVKCRIERRDAQIMTDYAIGIMWLLNICHARYGFVELHSLKFQFSAIIKSDF